MPITKYSVDRKTGMFNLFGLLRYDIVKQSGQYGVVLVFDLMKLIDVNRRFGQEIGDLHIGVLVSALKACLCTGDVTKCSLFRTGGDEFVAIVPGGTVEDGRSAANAVADSFRAQMVAHGYPQAGVHLRIVPYLQRIPAVHVLLKWVQMSLSQSETVWIARAEAHDWADDLIASLIVRLQETLRLLEQTHQLAMSDEISGLPNHRSAENYIEEMLGQHQLGQRPCSILFLDGDNLRDYNTSGYQCGNQMIRDLGAVIASALRDHDQVYRWLSGDEFLIPLPNTDRRTALRIAERVRQAVEVGTRNWQFPITISIGVASYPEHGETMDELMRLAESNLAAAKSAGKNQICPACAG